MPCEDCDCSQNPKDNKSPSCQGGCSTRVYNPKSQSASTYLETRKDKNVLFSHVGEQNIRFSSYAEKIAYMKAKMSVGCIHR